MDKDWVQAGTHHEATYTNLDPGQYVLKVKAANNDGVWNQQGTATAIHIVITPLVAYLVGLPAVRLAGGRLVIHVMAVYC